TGSRPASRAGSCVLVFRCFADRLGPGDAGGGQAGPRRGLPELPSGPLDRLVLAGRLHDELGTVVRGADAGGDAVAARDRVGQLDYFLAGRDPAEFGLDPYAPPHRRLLTEGL